MPERPIDPGSAQHQRLEVDAVPGTGDLRYHFVTLVDARP